VRQVSSDDTVLRTFWKCTKKTGHSCDPGRTSCTPFSLCQSFSIYYNKSSKYH